MNARYWRGVAILLGILSIPGVFLWQKSERPEGVATDDIALETQIETEKEAGGQNLPVSSLKDYAHLGQTVEHPPESLDGTDVDGRLEVDEDGNLVVGRDVRRVFEYFLATVGEVSAETASALLAAHIRSSLPSPAAEQAWSLFARYLEMKEAVADLPVYGREVEDLRSILARRQAVRESVLGKVAADAFYGRDTDYARYRLSEREIRSREDLTVAERQERLALLRRSAPATIRPLLSAPDSPAMVSRKVRSMREDGVSEQAVQRYRREVLGPEAAERLKALDDQRRQWQRDYDTYRQQRLAIERSGLSGADRQQAIEDLRQRLFDEQAVRRVRALDRIRRQSSDSSG